MTDSQNPTPAPTPVSSMFSDERQMAIIIYILFMVGFATFHTATIVGLVLAYVNRDGAPEWLRSHYTFQIRTFWIGLLYLTVSIPCMIVLIGFPMLLAAAV